jgi:hypothetical protein
MSDAMMMLSRGQGRERSAENKCSGKRNFCLAWHVHISCLSLAA